MSWTNKQRAMTMKAILNGILEPKKNYNFYLFVMTIEHEMEVSRIVEAMHRFFTLHVSSSPLPPKLKLQVNNCRRKSKNCSSFAYLDCLVVWKVLEEIDIRFVSIERTHRDIDEALSLTSKHFRQSKAMNFKSFIQGAPWIRRKKGLPQSS